MRAVIYAAKSTEDTHGSIPAQLEDCRMMAKGMAVVGEYRDESKSAYRGNRGDDLTRAMEHAERERCALIVQHSDRLARGDGDQARHLVEIVLWARKAGVRLMSVQDPQTFDGMGLVYAALMGDRNHEDSARKSKSVRDGLQRRADSGQPVGALPIGFKAEPVIGADGEEVIDVRGKVVTTGERVIDPEREPTVRRMFVLAERGSTPGEISRQLNREGATTIRGKTWTVRAVRTVLRNRVYVGEDAYPKLIEPEQFDAVQRWLDDGGRHVTGHDRGGRPFAHDFALAVIASCAHCGASMRSRRCRTGRRTYRCSNAMEGRNLCPESMPVPAIEAEARLVQMLHYATSDLDSVLVTQVQDRHREHSERKAALARLREQAGQLAVVREHHLAEYRRQVDAGRATAYLALEEVVRVDGERERIESAIKDTEAVIAEHADQPDADEVRDLISRLFSYARQQVEDAATVVELGVVVRRLFDRVTLGVIDGVLVVQATLGVVDNPQLTLV